ncbi:MAG: hemolysin family protein [Clostridia bacterium]|nr:hemolysin family protein [Clostridia bacterium]
MAVYLISAGIVICLVLSAYFSASEMSYSSCNTIRLEHEAEDGNEKAGLALQIAEKFDDALSAILIGNNLVNIACSSLGSVLVILIFGSDEYSWVSTVVLTLLVIIFGETIPKIVAKRNCNRLACNYSSGINALMNIFKPITFIVVGLVNFLTKKMKDEEEDEEDESVEELQSIIETAEGEGVLDKDRTELVQAAIDFSDISAYEVMTARVDVVAIDIEDDWEEILKTIDNSPYTRFPVYEDSIDNVIGVLHQNHLLRAMTENDHPDIRELLMPACYVYKTMKLPKVLAELRAAKQHLAIVTDEYSGTLGVLSMEDVLEELVGDIWDETDVVEEEVVKRSEKEMEIDGDMTIEDFLELYDIDEDEFECDSDTVGGWTVETFGSFPRPGDSFSYEDLKVTVLSMDGLRVEKVLVVRQ